MNNNEKTKGRPQNYGLRKTVEETSQEIADAKKAHLEMCKSIQADWRKTQNKVARMQESSLLNDRG